MIINLIAEKPLTIPTDFVAAFLIALVYRNALLILYAPYR